MTNEQHTLSKNVVEACLDTSIRISIREARTAGLDMGNCPLSFSDAAQAAPGVEGYTPDGDGYDVWGAMDGREWRIYLTRGGHETVDVQIDIDWDAAD